MALTLDLRQQIYRGKAPTIFIAQPEGPWGIERSTSLGGSSDQPPLRDRVKRGLAGEVVMCILIETEVHMVHGYHVILPHYGFWLPNDPRGSWSDLVYRWELVRFGRSTRHLEQRKLAQLSVE